MKYIVKHLLSLSIIIVLGFLLGMISFAIWDSPLQPLERVEWSEQTQWIASQEKGYRFYARKTFYIPTSFQAAWLRLSADNDFTLYVNGKVIAFDTGSPNVSIAFGSIKSDHLQKINNSEVYAANIEPGLFYAQEKDWKVTTYIELSPFLNAGKNVIAISLQDNEKSPRLALEGNIDTTESSSIKLDTGSPGWKVSSLSENHNGSSWFDVDFFDGNWAEAINLGNIKEKTYTRFSPNQFSLIPHGNWIGGIESEQGEVWLNKKWDIQKPKLSRSFLRFTGEDDFAIMINGSLVNSYDRSQLSNIFRIYEITNLLHSGINDITVRIARSINAEYNSKNTDTLRFFLDGWIENSQHKILSTIFTNDTWTSFSKPPSSWNTDGQNGQPAYNIGLPDTQTFRRTFEGDASLVSYPKQIWRELLWRIGGILLVLWLALLLGYVFNLRNIDKEINWGDNLDLGAAMLLPSTIFLIFIGLLKHRYAQSEQYLLFAQPQGTILIFLGAVSILLAVLIWAVLFTEKEDYQVKISTKRWQQYFLSGLIGSIGMTLGITRLEPSIVWLFIIFLVILIAIIIFKLVKSNFKTWIATVRSSFNHFFSDDNNNQFLKNYGFLIIIVIIGFCLRAYDLNLLNMDSDESTSLDAIRGIIKTGTPQAVSGIWYTRSPAFHYMTALWLLIVGDTVANARFLSVLWGTATLVMVFILSRKLTGSLWIALLITLILAIDPWSIIYSKFLRFYQIVQFLCCLSFWLFIKGFIEKKGRWYQYGFVIAITMALLNQEVTVTVVPGFILGFLFFYKPFRLSIDWPILFSSFVALVIFIYDIIFFSIKCLTPWIALSTTTDSIIKFHVLRPFFFPSSLFFGNNRIFTLYAFFFLLGFIYFLIKKNSQIIFVYLFIFLNLFILSVLVRQIALRYVYSIYPFFIILSVYSFVLIPIRLWEKFESKIRVNLPLKSIGFCFLVLLITFNIEPARVIAGYQSSISRRQIDIAEYVRDHRQPGDVYISASPPSAASTLGGLDYYLPSAIQFDILYWRDGRVLDRWAGGVLITNVDHLQHILEKSNRVWITVKQDNSQSLELINYLKTLGKPVVETYGLTLSLWQAEDGYLPTIPNRGRDLGSY